MKEKPEKDPISDSQFTQAQLEDLVCASFREIIDTEWAKIAYLSGVAVETLTLEEIAGPQRNRLLEQARWSGDYPTAKEING